MNIEALSSWLQQRRWYAAKNVPLRSVEVISHQNLLIDNTAVDHLIVAATTSVGRDLYQLWIRNFGQEGEVELFEDTDGLGLLFSAFKNGAASDNISFHLSDQVPERSTPRVITTEQSNSSVIFGDQVIAKFYRRITPGVNPDLEIGRALDAQNCSYVAPIRGWAEGNVEGQVTTLAVMHQFFSTAVDGFEYALSSVRDLIANELSPSQSGGDFAGEAERLGEAVRAIHNALADSFGTEEIVNDALINQMLERLDRATTEVPALIPHRDQIAEIYLSKLGLITQVQRIHGDLHLGQVLRDTSGWKVLDFEGEPGTPLAQRRQMGPTSRDVAGLLRSFDYAARQPLIGHPDQTRLLARTSQWAERNRSAFLRGYGSEPESLIFELDKAVYETLYEHRFRPDWIGVPLGGILRLLEAR